MCSAIGIAGYSWAGMCDYKYLRVWVLTIHHTSSHYPLLSQPDMKKVVVNGGNLDTYLGVRKFLPDRLHANDQVGLVTGLAWTAVGGDTLEVEVNVMDGTGKLELTGNLGDVM